MSTVKNDKISPARIDLAEEVLSDLQQRMDRFAHYKRSWVSASTSYRSVAKHGICFR